MSQTLEFAYRIEKGANMAHDIKTKEPTECYLLIKQENCRDNITEEEYNNAHLLMSENIPCISKKFVTLISREEYNRKCEINSWENY